MPYPNYEINVSGVKHLAFIYKKDLLIVTNHHVWIYNPQEGEVKEEFNFDDEITSIHAEGVEFIFGFNTGEISYNDGLREISDERHKISDSPITALTRYGNRIIAGDQDGNLYILNGEHHENKEQLKIADSAITCLKSMQGTILAASEIDPKLVTVDTQYNVEETWLDYPVTAICPGYRDEWLITGDKAGMLMRWSFPELDIEDAMLADASPVTAVEVIFDRPQIWTGHRDGKVKIFNLETKEQLGEAHVHEEPPIFAYYLYNSYLLSVQGDNAIDMWMLDKQIEEETEPEPVEEPIPECLTEAYKLIDRYDTTGTITATIKESPMDEQLMQTGVTLMKMADKLYAEDKSVGHILDTASRVFQEINAYKSLGDIAMLRGSMNRYGDDEMSSIQYGDAIEYYQAAEASKELAEAYLKHGIVSMELGDPEQAYISYSKALAITETHDIPLIRAETLRETARFMTSIEKIQEAENMLEKAYSLAQPLDRKLSSKILMEIAQLDFNQRRNELSIQRYTEAYKILTDYEDHFLLSICKLNIGTSLMILKRYDEAEKPLRTAIDHIKAQENQMLLKKSLRVARSYTR